MNHDTATVLLALITLAQGLLAYLKLKRTKRRSRSNLRSGQVTQ